MILDQKATVVPFRLRNEDARHSMTAQSVPFAKIARWAIF